MVVTRILLLFQLCTVFPLIMFILRSQAFMLFSRHEQSSTRKIYALNIGVLILCTMFAVLLPSIGTIIRYSGALCGAVVVFLWPSMVELTARKKEGRLAMKHTIGLVMIMLPGLANFCSQMFIHS